MDALIGKIEKAKPFFEKVSRNKYLKASVMDSCQLCQ